MNSKEAATPNRFAVKNVQQNTKDVCNLCAKRGLKLFIFVEQIIIW